ncbi:MAG: hypothetical protein E6G83_00005 [Alphaproteobacteria bacterium]|nr:MAG: hypothetical protein E6G83_00005 [Alphaproteobacteria bacterium]
MPLKRRQIAWRAAQDLADGAYVNLGIGLPTMVSDFIPADREIVLHSENGVLGVGPAPGDNEVDWDLINAGKQPITLVTGGSYVHHTDSFLMIRGGHLDLALLGAFEVSEKGDLANWTTDDPAFPPGVGGAMDLAVGAKEIRVLVEHFSGAAGQNRGGTAASPRFAPVARPGGVSARSRRRSSARLGQAGNISPFMTFHPQHC